MLIATAQSSANGTTILMGLGTSTSLYLMGEHQKHQPVCWWALIFDSYSIIPRAEYSSSCYSYNLMLWCATNPTMHQFQIPQCIILRMCAHFCYKMVHSGIFVRCLVEFVIWVRSSSAQTTLPIMETVWLSVTQRQWCVTNHDIDPSFAGGNVLILVYSKAFWSLGDTVLRQTLFSMENMWLRV